MEIEPIKTTGAFDATEVREKINEIIVLLNAVHSNLNRFSNPLYFLDPRPKGGGK